MHNSTNLPQTLFEFNSAPIYYYTNVRWEVLDNFDHIIVTTKKYNWCWLIVSLATLAIILILIGYYAGSFSTKELTISDNDVKLIRYGLTVAGVVLFLISSLTVMWYKFDFYIWENPRMTINKYTNDVSFQNGKISYTNVSCQDICLLHISGCVHTPYLKYKSHIRKQLYVCVRDDIGIWHRHLIAVAGIIESTGSTGSHATFQKNTDKLQRLIKCDIVVVQECACPTVGRSEKNEDLEVETEVVQPFSPDLKASDFDANSDQESEIEQIDANEVSDKSAQEE